MVEDVYRKLAKKLDERPNGFPSTSTGVEIEILKKIFNPDEAEMTLKIQSVPETAEAIAERLEKPVPEMRSILDAMAGKGQIGCVKMGGKQVYFFFPFIIGINSNQFSQDKKYLDLFEKYAPTVVGTVGGFKPALSRVIPVNIKVEPQTQILPYEDLHGLIDRAKSFRVRECICRRNSALSGNPCKHTLENCIGLSQEEGAFDYFLLKGRVISKKEAFTILAEAEEEGLVHCVSNFQHGIAFVCNCCSCSSIFLRGLKEFRAPYMLAKSNFVARIDNESCSSCSVCKEERCPMDAIVETNGYYNVLDERCIGCGVCTVTCPRDSITMSARPDKERGEPPINLAEWNEERAASRAISVKP